MLTRQKEVHCQNKRKSRGLKVKIENCPSFCSCTVLVMKCQHIEIMYNLKVNDKNSKPFVANWPLHNVLPSSPGFPRMLMIGWYQWSVSPVWSLPRTDHWSSLVTTRPGPPLLTNSDHTVTSPGGQTGQCSAPIGQLPSPGRSVSQ